MSNKGTNENPQPKTKRPPIQKLEGRLRKRAPDENLSCPKCGGEMNLNIWKLEYGYGYSIQCLKCEKKFSIGDNS